MSFEYIQKQVFSHNYFYPIKLVNFAIKLCVYKLNIQSYKSSRLSTDNYIYIQYSTQVPGSIVHVFYKW